MIAAHNCDNSSASAAEFSHHIKTMPNTRQNLFFAFAYNYMHPSSQTIMGPLAALVAAGAPPAGPEHSEEQGTQGRPIRGENKGRQEIGCSLAADAGWL
jgi:hypothetical protein